MVIQFEPASIRQSDDESPAHVNPILWQQSLGLARQISARVFRDGGRPVDALVAVGLAPPADGMTWDKVVDAIAAELSRNRGSIRRQAAA
ncbi:MAG: hypothetical protein R3D44_12290 [Hyphomicrobiaceae bacterium]